MRDWIIISLGLVVCLGLGFLAGAGIASLGQIQAAPAHHVPQAVAAFPDGQEI